MTNNLVVYMKQPTVLQRFEDVLGKGANAYVQSVIIAASDEKLQGCTELSVMKSALRAASLGLSCDPAQREAQLVPRNKKIKGQNGQPDKWIKEASFEPHYLGLYKLAIRTNKYWTISVTPVMKNQEVFMGRDGLHWVYQDGLKLDHFPVDRITAKNIGNVKGWLAYFKTIKGFEKTEYMSVEEIMEHAATYSDAYKRDLEKHTKYSTWNNPEVLPTMQMKTVLRQLLKWADTSGDAGEKLKAALEADEQIIEADAEEVTPSEDDLPVDEMFVGEKRTEEETVGELMGEPVSKTMPHPDLKPNKRETEKPQGPVGILLDIGVDNTSHAAKIATLLKFTNSMSREEIERKYDNYRSLRDNGKSSEEAAAEVLK